MERQDKTAVPLLRELARAAALPVGRAHALWTLQGLASLDDGQVEHALKDASAGVREQALRLAEPRLAANAGLRAAVLALADDPDPRVRFQVGVHSRRDRRPRSTHRLDAGSSSGRGGPGGPGWQSSVR